MFSQNNTTIDSLADDLNKGKTSAVTPSTVSLPPIPLDSVDLEVDEAIQSARPGSPEEPTSEGDEDDYEPWPRKDDHGRVIYASVNRYEKKKAGGVGRTRPFDILHTLCCVRSGLARHYIGNMPVLASSDGEPTLVMGSWWPFCMGITVPLIVGISTIIIVTVIVPNAPFYIFIVYGVLIVVTLVSLFFVSCKNPGLVEKREKVEGKNVSRDHVDRSKWIWNDRVKSYRPRGGLYCDTNDVVVVNYDHFCPWTGTSIGGRNMAAFKAFVISVNVLCYGTVGIIIFVFVFWPPI